MHENVSNDNSNYSDNLFKQSTPQTHPPKASLVVIITGNHALKFLLQLNGFEVQRRQPGIKLNIFSHCFNKNWSTASIFLCLTFDGIFTDHGNMANRIGTGLLQFPRDLVNNSSLEEIRRVRGDGVNLMNWFVKLTTKYAGILSKGITRRNQSQQSLYFVYLLNNQESIAFWNFTSFYDSWGRMNTGDFLRRRSIDIWENVEGQKIFR